MIEVNHYPFRVCLILMLLLVFAKAAPAETLVNSSSVDASVDWQTFLSRHDLIWDRVPFTPVELDEADLNVEPIPVSKANRNLFGLSDKTGRLPGHQHYYKK